jgi:hypothetical protein
MTPARLQLLVDTHLEYNSEHKSRKNRPSRDPAVDLAMLGAMKLT